MNLLLTSAGLTTSKLRDRLARLVGQDAKVAFIPTARTVYAGDKSSHLRAINNLQAAGLQWIDIVEISAEGVDWPSRLDAVDVIYLAGGNTFFLMHQLNKTGVGQWLKDHAEEKIYIGESAGSIVMTPSIAVAAIDDGDKNDIGITDLSGLNLVGFEVSPHTPEDVSMSANRAYAKETSNDLYAYNDFSAICVSANGVEHITPSKIHLVRPENREE